MNKRKGPKTVYNVDDLIWFINRELIFTIP